MLQEHGHLNPSFRLARNLMARGHEVAYLAIPDFEKHIESQGFRTIPFLGDVYPAGFEKELDALGKLERRRALSSRFDRLATVLSDRSTEDKLRALSPKMFLIDVCHTSMSMLAKRMGVPQIGLSTTFPQVRDRGIPPSRSHLVFRSGIPGELAAELEWQRMVRKRQLAATAMRPFRMAPPYDLARRAAHKFGVAPGELDTETAYMPQLRGVPELVLCPEPLDFPRAPHALRAYSESLDVERKSDVAFPWERLDPEKPLVYVSMSSQAQELARVRALFVTLAGIFARHSHWQAVLSLGRSATPKELGPTPANVIAVQRAPQLDLLKRAKLVITHGGLGSVKECIANAVPMIAIPLAVDQPGNGARITYHGLGVRKDIAHLDAGDLARSISEMFAAERFREAARRMQNQFEVFESKQTGSQFVEARLANETRL